MGTNIGDWPEMDPQVLLGANPHCEADQTTDDPGQDCGVTASHMRPGSVRSAFIRGSYWITHGIRGVVFVVAALCGVFGSAEAAKSSDASDKTTDVKADRQELEETDVLPAVQNRKYALKHEFVVGITHLPIDPFTKAMAVRGGYTWHLSHNWGVEGHFSWLFNYRSALREKLEGNFAEPESKFRRMKFFGQLGALFKPVYGKLAFLNSDQAYGEFYFSAYGVFGQLTGGEETENEPAGRGDRWAVGVAPGFGLRGFLTRHISIRADMNWLVLFTGGFLSTGNSPFEVVAPLSLSLNLAVTTR